MDTFISAIRSVAPPFVGSQPQCIRWLTAAAEKALASDPERQRRVLRLYERLARQPSLQQRRSVVEDFSHHEWENMRLFREWTRGDGTTSPWYAPPLEQRMNHFADFAVPMTFEAFDSPGLIPSYLIETTCTGYTSPSPGQKLLAAKGWHSCTRLIKIGHMGCYAALPVSDMARRLLAGADQADQLGQVSLVFVEFCTLHLRPEVTEPDQLVTNVLFADGCARVDVVNACVRPAFRLIAYHECLVPETFTQMGWDLAASAFFMTLDKSVPGILGSLIGDKVKEFLEREDLCLSDVTQFAIHPGGPKVIEEVQAALGSDARAVQHSQSVLRDRGNMSSATLPHIWEQILKDSEIGNELVVSIGFGPGLTMALSLMEKIP